jgi:hypothetical protein
MYEELIKRLRLQADVEKFYSGEPMLYDQAADAIENTSKAYQMMAEAYEAEVTKPRWIPVTERLPNGNGEYLVSGKDKVWLCEFMIIGDVGGWCNSARNPCVKYWMQLPEPPK